MRIGGKIPLIGTEVYYLGKPMVIRDIAYMSYTDDPAELATLDDGGELSFYLTTEGWVPANECEEYSPHEFFEQDERSPHLQDLGYAMVAWKDGLPDLPDNANIPAIVTVLMAIQYDKERDYGSSWKGKGEYRGIMANIDRKYDRLDAMTNSELADATKSLKFIETALRDSTIMPQSVGESKIDAVADLANYCILYMTYVRDHFPLCFNIWVERNVPLYLRDKITFLEK